MLAHAGSFALFALTQVYGYIFTKHILMLIAGTPTAIAVTSDKKITIVHR